MIFLLKYWKLIVGIAAVAALSAVILVLHLELSAAQSSLVRARTELATAAQALRTQNAAVAQAGIRERSVEAALRRAQHRAQRVRIITRTLIEHVRTAPVGPTCTDAMDFLRREGALFAPPIPGHRVAGGPHA